MKNFRPNRTTSDAGTRRPLSRFARRLSQAWRQLALPEDARVVVAVSGGADSTALLLALDELIKTGRLSLTLKVAHLDHGLRSEAGAADARFVAELAADLGYEATIGRASVAERASETRDNVEQAARRVRYEFLGDAARASGASVVAVAHTLEDQAETLLLALLRGSGARGLGGMSACRAFEERGGELLLVRPLLEWARRAETLEYCKARGVVVRADEMNADEQFARVRVRRQLLPLLATFNPRAVETLGRTARLLRAEADALERLAAKLLDEARCVAASKAERAARGARVRSATDENGATDESGATDENGAMVESGAPENAPPLSVEVLRGADGAVLSYALRSWIREGRGNLRRVEAGHVAAVAALLEGVRGGRVAELPGGARVERRRGLLLFHPAGERRVRV